MKTITASNTDDLKEFTTLKDSNLTRENKIVCDSEKVVLKLISSKIEIYKIIGPESFFKKHSSTINFNNFDCYSVSKNILQEITGYRLHTGVMALAKRPLMSPLDELSFPAIILNGITSPENVGGIVRSARAFSINSLIFDQQSCGPLTRRAIRVSMGNIFGMKLYKSENLIEDLQTLKNSDVTTIGTANIDSAKCIHSYKFQDRSAIIIGSEGHGLSPDVIDSCEQLLKIPINENVAALNATSAATIFMYALKS